MNPVETPQTGLSQASLRKNRSWRWQEHGSCEGLKIFDDHLVEERPLKVSYINRYGEHSPLITTMRTPGQDLDLILGTLFSEGLIATSQDVSVNLNADGDGRAANDLGIELGNELGVDEAIITFHHYPEDQLLRSKRRLALSTSSCGVCGDPTLGHLQTQTSSAKPQKKLQPHQVLDLADVLSSAQKIFHLTGGIHGCATISFTGELKDCREDIGRHNAFDKLIGSQLQHQRYQFADVVTVFSGRISYEIMQKALKAGCRTIAAIGSPSSLAVALARQNGIALIGFLKGDRFNVYTGRERFLFDKRTTRPHEN